VPKLTDEQIEQVAVQALANSLGGPDTEIGALRLRNLEAYNALAEGEFAPPEVADRSDFVATDVADTVNGMLPNILQMFVSSDDAVEFEGKGQPGSDLEAKLATAYVNHLFYVENDGLSVLHDWFWDAMVQKVGFVKVWVEEEAEDSKQTYEGQAPEQLLMLQQDGWQLAEAPEQDENGLLTFTVTKEDRRKQIRVQAVAPAEMRVDQASRWDADPAMIGHVFYKRRYQWEEDGVDVSEIGNGSDRNSQEMLAVLGEADDTGLTAPHSSHDLIKGAELYIKLDADGDGVAEWLKICLVEDKLAVYTDGTEAWSQVDGHPFVWICPSPRPHSFYGDCPADQAFQPQKLRTHTVRAIQDNLFQSVNTRTYVNTAADVNIGDVLDSRPGGVIRGRGPASEAIQPIAQPNLGAPAYQFNEWVASWGENRTGFNRYAAGTDANALNKTARGTELLTAKADMRMGLIARHFALGVRKLFAKMLKLAIQHQNVPTMVKLGQQFVPINPGEFKDQLRVKINVGLGTGTKEQQSARIMALAEILAKLGQPAGVVRPEHVAEVIRLFIEANEFKNPERFVDPQPSGMPPTVDAFKQMQAQVEQQMNQLQQQVQQLGQENESLKADKQGERAQLALEAGKLDLQADKQALDRQKAEADFELRRTNQQADIAGRIHEASREQDGDDRVAQLEQHVAALTQAVMQMMGAR
jgi:hypothetical protein